MSKQTESTDTNKGVQPRRTGKHITAHHALLQTIINSPEDIIVFSLDTQYRYTSFNDKHRREMQAVWHVDIEIGMNILDCMNIPELRDLAKRSVDRALRGESFSEEQHQLNLDIYYELSWSPVLRGKAVLGVAVFIRDITQRKRAEAALKASQARLAEAQRIAHIGNWDRNIITNELHWSDEICRIFGLQLLESVLTYDSFLNFVHPDDREYVLKSVKEVLNGDKLYNIDHRIVLPSGEVRIVHEQGEVAFDEAGEPMRMIGTVQDITELKRAEENLSKTLDRLRNALGGIVQVLAMTTEKRDPYTAGHQQRVADLARAVGQEMGLPPDRVEGLRIVGVIHDIGKVSIPAEILSKPTRLTELEYELVQTHSKIGYDILHDIDFSWPLAEMVHQHHERMNGSGYPRRLAGDDILLEARILAVSDVVEAMASHRPYRPALGIEAALAEIEKNKGILYDSEAASACLTLFREKRFDFK